MRTELPAIWATQGCLLHEVLFFDLRPFWWIWNKWRRKEMNYGGEGRGRATDG